MDDWNRLPPKQGLSTGQKWLVVLLILIGVLVALSFNALVGSLL